MELKNKVVIVTGGGTGIGKASALKLAEKGAKVVVNYSQSEIEAYDVVNKIKDLGGIALAFRANVSVEKEVINLADYTAATFGTVDGLINNASITAHIPMDDLSSVTDDVWDNLFGVNVKGMFHCIKAVMPYMKKNSGAIVNVGSVAGITGIGSSVPYAATKAAIHTMTRSLAIALAPEIRVNSIAPGAVVTRWWEGNEDRMTQLSGSLPLKRISTPDEIAESILFQMTQDSITGQVFVVDSGQTL